MYKAAILGCRGRSKGHAQAYEHVKKGRLVAICDMDRNLLDEFGDEFGIDNRYTDLEEMLDKEKPDLLHIVTRPSLRVPLMTLVSEHGVPAALVEKPIALDGEPYNDLVALSRTTKTRFAVNHQLHFHPKCLELQRDVAEGKIGEVRFTEVSARLNMLGQGTHILELLFAFNPGRKAVSVFGQVADDGRGQTFETTHPAPNMAEAVIDLDDGTHALLLCGHNAPSVGDVADHMHKRIAVYGSHGFVEWQMNAWERFTCNGYESGKKSYGEEDLLGQAGLTEAMFDWLDDDRYQHPTRLDVSLQQFNVVLGLYASALEHKPIKLPFEPKTNLIDKLKETLR